MSSKPGNINNIFRSNKWLMVIGVIIAVILAIVVEGGKWAKRRRSFSRAYNIGVLSRNRRDQVHAP